MPRSLGSDMARNGTAVIQRAPISTSKCPLPRGAPVPHPTPFNSTSLSSIDRSWVSLIPFWLKHHLFFLSSLQPTDSGFVLLGDLSVETSTDTDYDDYSMCPPSPCDVEFENANIVIDGKSSIRQKSKDSSVSIVIIRKCGNARGLRQRLTSITYHCHVVVSYMVGEYNIHAYTIHTS